MSKSDFPQLPDYEILSLIGTGGTARVYLGAASDGSKVAIKVLHEYLASSSQVRKLLRREASTLQRVQGPGVAKLLDFDISETLTYLVMEYVEGETLESLVASKPLNGIFLNNTISGIIEALESVHTAGIVHQDLKPSNVVLGPNGATVLDFGLSIIEEASSATRPLELGGTPAWISPEQVTGSKVTTASDVFNLGMLIAFLATGQNPFGTGKPEALLYRIANSSPDLQKLDPHLRRIVSACLSKASAERPSLEQVKSLLQGVDDSAGESNESEGDRTVLASQTSIARAFEVDTGSSGPGKVGKKPRRKLLAAIVAGLAAVSLLALDVFVFDYGGDVVFRYLNSSENNQPQTSSTVRIVIDGQLTTIALPSSSTPKETQEIVGRWNLDSVVSVTASPSFTQDKETTAEGSGNVLGLSRFRAGQDLVIEVELTDSQTNARVGFGSQLPLANASVSAFSPRSNEARILAQEAAKEEQFFAEQRRLYNACVDELEAGWLSELNPVLDLERDYWSLRDSYFDGELRDFDEWAQRAYGLSNDMVSRGLVTVSPARSDSSYAQYSPTLIQDAGFVFETHYGLLDSWSNLGDAIFYYTPSSGGLLRDLFPRQYIFIDEFESQLQEASRTLRSTITADASLFCAVEFPEGVR